MVITYCLTCEAENHCEYRSFRANIEIWGLLYPPLSLIRANGGVQDYTHSGPNFAWIVTYCHPYGAKYCYNTALFDQRLKSGGSCTHLFCRSGTNLACGLRLCDNLHLHQFTVPSFKSKKAKFYHIFNFNIVWWDYLVRGGTT